MSLLFNANNVNVYEQISILPFAYLRPVEALNAKSERESNQVAKRRSQS